MVCHTHQYMIVVGDAEKLCPQRDLGGQVKGVTAGLSDGLSEVVLRPSGGIDDIPTEFGPLGGHHYLLGNPLGRRDQRAQALVAPHHVGQRGDQRVDIEASAQPQRHRHVVNR